MKALISSKDLIETGSERVQLSTYIRLFEPQETFQLVMFVPRFSIGMEIFVGPCNNTGDNCVNSMASKNWGIWCRCCITFLIGVDFVKNINCSDETGQ